MERSPDAITALIESSDVPLAAVDLPSGRFLAVNQPMASALGSTVGAITGLSSLDWLSPDDRCAARLGLQALADGDLIGYQNPEYAVIVALQFRPHHPVLVRLWCDLGR